MLEIGNDGASPNHQYENKRILESLTLDVTGHEYAQFLAGSIGGMTNLGLSPTATQMNTRSK
jgi:hypothetical protein